ncbi:hypothetical protein EX30DRAFT_345142 [Ascodesmis nigricans]|uniref:Uncharacterized protein n=1 Tax=Ascodesmis nigricans TaxID=341454 RepID=A0A4S2MH41_9PEZI|nr:hypothetical protein EX30DRAFT_345142 [Ascodesmis nigricans]
MEGLFCPSPSTTTPSRQFRILEESLAVLVVDWLDCGDAGQAFVISAISRFCPVCATTASASPAPITPSPSRPLNHPRISSSSKLYHYQHCRSKKRTSSPSSPPSQTSAHPSRLGHPARHAPNPSASSALPADHASCPRYGSHQSAFLSLGKAHFPLASSIPSSAPPASPIVFCHPRVLERECVCVRRIERDRKEGSG